MRDSFHGELSKINEILVRMTDLARVAMDSATTALLTSDLRLAEAVISGDAQIDALHRELEERSMDLLARQQPVAVDLRTIIGGLRMVSSLERMGDLARHVATIARMRYPDCAVPADLKPIFAEAAQVADKLVVKTRDVLVERDVSLAAEIAKDDDRMDELHRELFARVLDDNWSHGMEAAIDVTLLGRFYERYADHAVSLARRMVQLVTGVLPTNA
ncbi:phosphate signaling complex protein PhoU [Cryptosporangium aurantiacum]|uniref:Phosphate-specific transport system accessory protein PhoU n=1 Tax=Cryptosporangium aurantiacum TaxID=134849 RepID=A0A1M7RHB3_9ACTN|nr:phosphate signaling complex protein PhoU [Cryptosporangium aurantiacum]SHN45644.1 phosphate uptake regulator, PhoU [Cryptosporangium aurantiacum]